jgi:hypothetical protein
MNIDEVIELICLGLTTTPEAAYNVKEIKIHPPSNLGQSITVLDKSGNQFIIDVKK